jgi:hypothetical protein
MAVKLTRLAHKIAIQLHLVAENGPFAVLAPGGQSGKFWIYPRIGSWMGPRAGLDVVANGKIPISCWESNPHRPTRSLVTILTELSRLTLLVVKRNLFTRSLSLKLSPTEPASDVIAFCYD